jgi:ABC-type amino acid transport substrate-binding protein
MQPLYPPAPAKVIRESGSTGEEKKGDGVLASIYASGVLRVGYLLNRPPYSYMNASGNLVGFDVEMAGRLAGDLGVQLVFVPVKTNDLEAAVNRGDVDIVMSGIVITASRASAMLFSEPYQEETLAFLVKDHLRDQFSSWESIRAIGPMTIGAPGLPYFVSLLSAKLPEARFETIDSDRLSLPRGERLDVILLSAERASILTMLYPEYAVAVPDTETLKVPIAYPIGSRDQRFRVFIDTWIELQRRNGTINDLYAHWILGKNVEKHKPRWSVIRNVLHWVD